MKILHLTGKDYFGAGRAAYRLHSGLRQVGVDSIMFVGDKHSDDPGVVDVQKGKLSKLAKKLLVRAEKRWLRKNAQQPEAIYSTGWHALTVYSKIREVQPDLIHLHWINRGFMNINDLMKVNIPVVVTMHDMWYFTGGCHYASGCRAFEGKCGKCPVLGSSCVNDSSAVIYARKSEIYSQVKPYFIAPSTWMKSEALKSSLLSGSEVCRLANGIDTGRFRHQAGFRERLGISSAIKVVLFAAVNATSDTKKGFTLLMQAVAGLQDAAYEFLVLGGDGKSELAQTRFKVHNIGYVARDEEMIGFLSAADVVVVPSREENLSNMIMESLSCATPVVAFDIGGNGDMIDHKDNGYLAVPFDTEDLARGIEWCIEDKDRHDQLSRHARAKVESQFEISRISREHIHFYQKILEGYAVEQN